MDPPHDENSIVADPSKAVDRCDVGVPFRGDRAFSYDSPDNPIPSLGSIKVKDDDSNSSFGGFPDVIDRPYEDFEGFGPLPILGLESENSLCENVMNDGDTSVHEMQKLSKLRIFCSQFEKRRGNGDRKSARISSRRPDSANSEKSGNSDQCVKKMSSVTFSKKSIPSQSVRNIYSLKSVKKPSSVPLLNKRNLERDIRKQKFLARKTKYMEASYISSKKKNRMSNVYGGKDLELSKARKVMSSPARVKTVKQKYGTGPSPIKTALHSLQGSSDKHTAIHSQTVGDGKIQNIHSKDVEIKHKIKDEIDTLDESIDSKDFIGTYCSQVGCTVSWLESMATKLVSVNNGMVFELDEFARKINWERIHVAKWILRLMNISDREPTEEDMDAIHQVIKRRKALTVTLAGRKSGFLKLQDFDSFEFFMPSTIKREEENHDVITTWDGIVSEKETHSYGKSDCKEDYNVNKETISHTVRMSSRARKPSCFGKDFHCEKIPLQNTNGSSGIKKKLKVTKSKKRSDILHKLCSSPPKLGKYLRDGSECKISYIHHDNRMYPCFLDTEHHIGNCCLSTGLTVKDLNSLAKKNVCVTMGMIVELYKFYENHGCNIVYLADALKKFNPLYEINLYKLEMAILAVVKAAKKGSKFKNTEFLVERCGKLIEDLNMLCCHLQIQSKLIRKCVSVNYDNRVSFYCHDGGVYPYFKEINYFLGKYCEKAGLTINELNSLEKKPLDITIGMILELYDFFCHRGCSLIVLSYTLTRFSKKREVNIRSLKTLVSRIAYINRNEATMGKLCAALQEDTCSAVVSKKSMLLYGRGTILATSTKSQRILDKYHKKYSRLVKKLPQSHSSRNQQQRMSKRSDQHLPSKSSDQLSVVRNIKQQSLASSTEEQLSTKYPEQQSFLENAKQQSYDKNLKQEIPPKETEEHLISDSTEQQLLTNTAAQQSSSDNTAQHSRVKSNSQQSVTKITKRLSLSKNSRQQCLTNSTGQDRTAKTLGQRSPAPNTEHLSSTKSSKRQSLAKCTDQQPHSLPVLKEENVDFESEHEKQQGNAGENIFERKNSQPCSSDIGEYLFGADGPSVFFYNYNGKTCPYFKNTNHFLGKYCSEAGITIRDLNSREHKKVRVTQGMVYELVKFFQENDCSMTLLANKLWTFRSDPTRNSKSLRAYLVALSQNKRAINNDVDFMNSLFIYPGSRLQQECKLGERDKSMRKAKTGAISKSDGSTDILSKKRKKLKENSREKKNSCDQEVASSNEHLKKILKKEDSEIVFKHRFDSKVDVLALKSGGPQSKRLREKLFNQKVLSQENMIKQNRMERGVKRELEFGMDFLALKRRKIQNKKDKEKCVRRDTKKNKQNSCEKVNVASVTCFRKADEKDVSWQSHDGVNNNEEKGRKEKATSPKMREADHKNYMAVKRTSKNIRALDDGVEVLDNERKSDQFSVLMDSGKHIEENNDKFYKQTVTEDNGNASIIPSESLDIRSKSESEAEDYTLVFSSSEADSTDKEEDFEKFNPKDVLNKAGRKSTKHVLKCEELLTERESSFAEVDGRRNSKIDKNSQETENKIQEEGWETKAVDCSKAEENISTKFYSKVESSDMYRFLISPKRDTKKQVARTKKNIHKMNKKKSEKSINSPKLAKNTKSKSPKQESGEKKKRRVCVGHYVNWVHCLEKKDKRVSFSMIDGRIIPHFYETYCDLGKYCNTAGLTVSDLNTRSPKEVHLTNGAVVELLHFYRDRHCTLTALADRLLSMKKIYLNGIVSMVSKLSSLERSCRGLEERLSEEFRFPPGMRNVIKVTPRLPCFIPPRSDSVQKITDKFNFKNDQHNKMESFHLKESHNVQSGVEKESCDLNNSMAALNRIYDETERADEKVAIVEKEIEMAKGREGSVTRADIVLLYSEWLKKKKKDKVGNSVFVSDLLHDVVQLMEERKVEKIRIPAGTLMSSSVKLYEEYKQMWNVSKEDAVMYLEEDWIEDIQYLVSVTQKSRRNTIEEENSSQNNRNGNLCDGEESAHSPSHHAKSTPVEAENNIVDDSSENSLRIDESVVSAESGSIDLNENHNTSRESVNPELSLSNRVTDGKSPTKFAKISQNCTKFRTISVKDGRKEMSQPNVDIDNEDTLLKTLMGSTGKNVHSNAVSITTKSVEERKANMAGFSSYKANKEFLCSLTELIKDNAKYNADIYNREHSTLQKESMSNVVPSSRNGHQIENIVDYKYVIDDNSQKNIWYLVKWCGLGHEDNTWIRERDLRCSDTLLKFVMSSSSFRDILRDKMKWRDIPRHCEHLGNLVQHLSKAGMANGALSDGNHNENSSHNIDECNSDCHLLKKENCVTNRELLHLYDTWRNNNLMAPEEKSDSLNTAPLLSAFDNLLSRRDLNKEYSKSMLQVCFLLTLKRRMLSSFEAQKQFLDQNCIPLFEAIFNHQNCHKLQKLKDSGITDIISGDFLLVQKNFNRYKEGNAKNVHHLGILEYEMECLERSYIRGCSDKDLFIGTLKQEISRISDILKSNDEEMDCGGKFQSLHFRKQDHLENPEVFDKTSKELLQCGVDEKEVESVMDMILYNAVDMPCSTQDDSD